MFSVLVVGALGFSIWNHERKLELERARVEEQERRYEDKFRSGLTRIYQNLKLEHFLAAYKNLETMPKPRVRDAQKMRDYIEVLYRIGNGLLQNQLLKESEEVFLQVRELEGQVTGANESLSRIESKRRLDSAKLYIEEGKKLAQASRFREANQEFEKANLELRSVESLRFDDVATLWDDLNPRLLEARFYTLMEDVELYIKAAEDFLEGNRYAELNQQLSRASGVLGRAAFLRPSDSLVRKARERLLNLDAEIGFRLPNLKPLWNGYRKEDRAEVLHFFFIESYTMSPDINEKGEVVLGMNFLLDPRSDFYIVRYRIYFRKGQSVFNGHFITPNPENLPDEVLSVEYRQEIPEALRNQPILRIEMKVYDQEDQIVSRIERAFRVS